VLHASLVLPHVFSSINPLFLAVAFLYIILKLAPVLASVNMSVLPIAICHVILEAAFVDVSLGMPKCSLAFSPVVRPLPFVVGSISPELNSITMSNYRRNFVSLLRLLLLSRVAFSFHEHIYVVAFG
jgi:hypothetical protein